MKGDTSFSTLFKQFHKALTRHYANGGASLSDPSKLESFCDEHSPGMFEEIHEAIFNDDKREPSAKRRSLQRTRVVAVLHNLSFFRNQVVCYENLQQNSLPYKKKLDKQGHFLANKDCVYIKQGTSYLLHTKLYAHKMTHTGLNSTEGTYLCFHTQDRS